MFWLWSLSRWLKSYSVWVTLASDILVAAFVIHIYNKQGYSISISPKQDKRVADGKLASVGTANMDFRSFHHNFENGVLLYNAKTIEKIQEDFQALFEISKNVTEKYHNRKKHTLSFTDRFLRLFSTLL